MRFPKEMGSELREGLGFRAELPSGFPDKSINVFNSSGTNWGSNIVFGGPGGTNC